MSQPIRTCIACRTKREKKQLLRLTGAGANQARLDQAQKMDGRGLYLCYSIECLKKFKGKKFLHRHFQNQLAPGLLIEIEDCINGRPGQSA